MRVQPAAVLDPILDEHGAIVGVSGSGKTVTGKSRVEQLLREQRHLAAFDPTGAWYGLRSNVAGDGPGFDIPIFGGDHGDVPIRPLDGAAIARIVVEQRVSAIVDLSGFDDGEQHMFALDFFAQLRRKPRGNFHLILDEADEFAPQTPTSDVQFAVRKAVEWFAKRGRLPGFVLTLIPQRPADISKAVLGMMQSITFHQLIADQDVKAIDGWLKRGDKATAAEILASLPGLQAGERWVYAPRAGILERGVTPPIATFDSSRTPAPGEHHVEPRTLGQIDVAAIRAALAPPATEQSPEPGGLTGPSPDAERLQARNAELEEQLRQANNAVADLKGIGSYWKAKAQLAIAVLQDDGVPVPAMPPRAPAPPPGTILLSTTSKPAVHKAKPPASPPPAPMGAPRALRAERRILAVLAWGGRKGLTDPAWALVAGMSRKGGAWGTNRSRLNVAGLIEKDGDVWRATAAGLAAIGDDRPELPPPGAHLAAWWGDKIPGVGRMVRRLIELYPRHIARDALAVDLGMAPGGGAFGTYLSRLRTAGLLEDQGKRIRLAPALMGGGS